MNKNQIIPIYIFISLSVISIIIGGIVPTVSNFDTLAFADVTATRKNLSYTDNTIWTSSSSGLHDSTINSFYYQIASSYMPQQYNDSYSGLPYSTSANSSTIRNDFRKITEQKQDTA